MTYTFLPIFLVLCALAILYVNWRRGRQFEENQKEIQRLHQQLEELKQKLEKQKQTTEEYKGLHLVESDEEGTTN